MRPSYLNFDKKNNYRLLEKGTGDPAKSEAANIFYTAWQLAENNSKYTKQKKVWKTHYG